MLGRGAGHGGPVGAYGIPSNASGRSVVADIGRRRVENRKGPVPCTPFAKTSTTAFSERGVYGKIGFMLDLQKRADNN